MTRWVTILLAITLLFLVIGAAPQGTVRTPFMLRVFTAADYTAMIRWSGCHAVLMVDDQVDVLSSYYQVREGTGVLYLGLKNEAAIPSYAGIMVIFHEIGHCLQVQEEGMAAMLQHYREDPQFYELDADRRAADLACDYGFDGRRLLRETFEWARETFGYTGDPWHGSLDKRIAQGMKATHCERTYQSP